MDNSENVVENTLICHISKSPSTDEWSVQLMFFLPPKPPTPVWKKTVLNERARSCGSGKNKSISVIPDFDLVMTILKYGADPRP